MPIKMFINSRLSRNEPVEVYGFTSYQTIDGTQTVAVYRRPGSNTLNTINIGLLTFEPIAENAEGKI